MKTSHYLMVLLLGLLTACNSKSAQKEATTSGTASISSEIDTAALKPATTAEILARREVPVICYHQIRDWKVGDSKRAHDDIISPDRFREHLKMLADSGYHSILPDQLYDYLVYGKKLPEKPVMFTFDDTDLDQFTVAAPILNKYGFKAVYFIMTVSIGKKGKFVDYMSADQIKQLSDEGNVIGSHTYDHKNFKKYAGKDWEEQLDKPTKKLEQITGKKITEFAYPFGLWNAEGIPELKKRGFKMAYQLSTKRDEKDPLFTIRRIIASGYWSPKTLSNSIKNSF